MVTPVRRVFADASGCRRQGASTVRLDEHLRPALDPAGGPYYLRVSYRGSNDVSLPVYVDTGTGYPAVPAVAAWLVAGEHDSIAWLSPEVPRAIMHTLPARNQACVSAIDVVAVRPR